MLKVNPSIALVSMSVRLVVLLLFILVTIDAYDPRDNGHSPVDHRVRAPPVGPPRGLPQRAPTDLDPSHRPPTDILYRPSEPGPPPPMGYRNPSVRTPWGRPANQPTPLGKRQPASQGNQGRRVADADTSSKPQAPGTSHGRGRAGYNFPGDDTPRAPGWKTSPLTPAEGGEIPLSDYRSNALVSSLYCPVCSIECNLLM